MKSPFDFFLDFFPEEVEEEGFELVVEEEFEEEEELFLEVKELLFFESLTSTLKVMGVDGVVGVGVLEEGDMAGEECPEEEEMFWLCC